MGSGSGAGSPGGVHATAAAAFRRPPLTAFPASAATGSADASSACLRCAALHAGCAEATSAAAPATCGVAIEVPLIAPKPPPRWADVIDWPGANRSTVVAPKFENDAGVSSERVAPTQTMFGSL